MFFERFVRSNAEILSTLLRTAAEKIEEIAPGRPAAVSAGWQYPVKPDQEVRIDMGEISVSNETAVSLTAAVTFKDAKGHDTTADDVPQWSSSDGAVGHVTPSEDGLSAEIGIPGQPGSTIITVNSTNDDGSTVTATGLINVAAGDATVGSVEFTETPEAPAEEPPA